MVNALLPLDNFVVINRSILNSNDRNSLILLYQPIIGITAISLYFTLWSYLDNNINSQEITHNDLINNLQMKLDDIKEAREKLEAIGLIKAYVKKGEVNNYVYELYSPLPPFDFINNPILNTALYNNVSKKEYKRIIEQFSLPKIDLKNYEDVSKSFKDVFAFTSSDIAANNNIKKINHLGLSFEPNINFNEVLSLIKEDVLNVKSIGSYLMELIYQMAFIYNLNDENVSQIIINSIVDGKIDAELFKENCHKFYKFEHTGNVPKLVYQNQPLYLRKQQLTNSKKDKLINQFETTTPSEFLELKQGSKPTQADLMIIESLIVDRGLNPGVVNVLVDYSLKINNNKLVKKFIDQIAVQWKRSNILTVNDAIEFAQKEYDLKRQPVVEVKRKSPSWVGKNIEEEYLSDEELERLEKQLRGE